MVNKLVSFRKICPVYLKKVKKFFNWEYRGCHIFVNNL